MTDSAAQEPFGPTSNPKAYVPRPATERALARLAESIASQSRAVALTGPPGMGKTLLLHLLPSQLPGELRSVYLPYAALSPEDLATLVMAELEGRAPEGPVEVLRAYVAHLRETGAALVLRIDDASSMPPRTASWLGELARGARGALQIVLAAVDGPDTDRVVASIGSQVDVVRLVEPMSESEAHRHVAAQLAFADASDEMIARFDEATVSRLHAISSGIPARLNAAAAAVARGADPEVYGAILEATEPAPDVAPGPDEVEEQDEEGREGRAGPAQDDEEHELQRLRYAAKRPPERRVEPPPPLREVARTVVVLVLAVAAIGFLRAYAAVPVVEATMIEATPPLPSVEAAPPPIAAPLAVGVAPEPAGEVADVGPFEVQINATPWATIEIDGVPMGETPLAGVPLLAGRHVVRARMADGRVLERTVEIDADNRFIAFR